MKADITNLTEFDGLHRFRKESAGLYRQISAIDPATGREIVCARIYWPGSVAYACLWVFGSRYGAAYGSGAGKAGGGGYCKQSAALAVAIDRAGIVLDSSIDGRGTQAMRDAVETIARAVTGKRKVFVVEAHA